MEIMQDCFFQTQLCLNFPLQLGLSHGTYFLFDEKDAKLSKMVWDIKLEDAVVLSFWFGLFMGPLHETGHYLAYTLFGYPATFHYDSISCPIPIANSTQAFIITAAGWSILYFAAFSSLLYSFKSKTFVYFSLAVLIWGVDAFDSALELVGLEHGDKYSLSTMLGLSGSSIPFLTLTLDIIFLYLSFQFLNKSGESDKNKMSWLLGTLIAGGIGVVLWLLVIGPVVLP
jgi:hypothetical protein